MPEDFVYLEAARNEPPITDTYDDESTADTTVDYSELIKESAFIGEIPFATIIEGIRDQFNDYIGTDDRTNYVEAFYSQLHNSLAALEADDEEHPREKEDALNGYLNQFVSMMDELFEKRLAITLIELDADEYDQDEIEYEVKELYEFFILHAKDTFKSVIVKSISSSLSSEQMTDQQYYAAINDRLRYYSPLVIAMEPMEFLRTAKNDDVYEMFEDGRVCGNFLRKYSPKLYQYPEFEVDIVSEITMRQQLKTDLLGQKEV